MKYFIVAGEASGDLHGANLMRSIVAMDKGARFQFWGGDKMKAVADGLLVHYKDVTVMGFVEVLMSLPRILGNISLCKQQIIAFQPDVVVFIDYPGFNLRIAEYCKKHGIKTVYYISPKVWAWKENRAKKLERFVDELLLIFPFEVNYFKKWRVKSTYIGNPLLDEIAAFVPAPDFRSGNNLDTRPVIALLPGSRRQEVNKMLPIMLEAGKRFGDYQLVIAGAPGLSHDFYAPYLDSSVKIVFNQAYDLLHHSTAAIVCSGTATLETALFNVPQVCGYAGNPISYFIIRMLVKIRFISLVNLCLDRKVITELIQQDATAEKFAYELSLVMPGTNGREQMLADYSTLQQLLGGPGASDKAAAIVVQTAQK